MCEDIMVNGFPLSKWGGKSHLDYTIGESAITTNYFLGKNQTNWITLDKTFGLRTIKIKITFTGSDLHEAKMRRSRFNAELYGKSEAITGRTDSMAELFIPDDGFYYSVMLTNCGAEELIGIGQREAQVRSTYTFSGFRHMPLVTYGPLTYAQLISSKISCDSTIPFTNYKISAHYNGSGSFTMWNGRFNNLPNQDNLCVLDGIDKKITVNGVNWSANFDFDSWPRFTPGENTAIIGVGGYDCYIEYYPTFL